MLSDVFVNFIREHLNDDLSRLLLSAHRYPDIAVPDAVRQIAALRKIRTKVPAWYRFDLVFPPQVSVEQASSERTARFKAGLFFGRRMADLTGGMGVDTYFFSDCFDQVTYVEQDTVLVGAARHNFGVLGRGNIATVQAEAEEFLQETPPGSFDLLYLDPARRDDLQGRVVQLTDCRPNVVTMKDILLSRAPRVLLKAAPLLDVQLAVHQLGTVTHIWVVSVDNEVKELLLLLENQHPYEVPAPDGTGDHGNVNDDNIGRIPIEAVCLGSPDRTFVFTRAAEQAATPHYSLPLHYLYEPDAAILKAGAFKLFGARFGLAKLHPNSHLYTSAALVQEVPGRVFKIEAAVKYARKPLGVLVPGGKANVAVRNFPDSVEVVRKKLGLADGGDVYVFGTRTGNGQLALLVCRRVR